MQCRAQFPAMGSGQTRGARCAHKRVESWYGVKVYNKNNSKVGKGKCADDPRASEPVAGA